MTARSGSTLRTARWKIAMASRRSSRRTEGIAREDSACRVTARTESRLAPTDRAFRLSGRRRGALGSLILEPESGIVPYEVDEEIPEQGHGQAQDHIRPPLQPGGFRQLPIEANHL